MKDSKVFTGDLLKIDWWTDANIIFIANVLFGEELNGKIADLCQKLQIGTRIAVLEPLPTKPYLHRYFQMITKMSWGNHTVTYYII